MTTTATGVATADPITTWLEADRAEFLREVAQQVAIERPRSDKTYTRAARELVPHVASIVCPEPLVVFDELVAAVEALAGFEQHPRWNAEADAEQAKVDRLVARLLGTESS